MGKRKKNKNSSVFLDEVNNIDPSFEDDIAKGVEIVNKNKEELKRQRNKRINRFERNANGKMIERPKIRYQISSSTILIIFAFIILIVWLLHNYGPIFGININNNTSTSIEDNKIELVTKDSDIYGMYDDQLYVYSNNTITLYNEKSEVTWTYNFSESFSPKIYVKEKYMLVTNNSTGRIYLFENQNEILNKKIDGTIKNSFIDKYGNIAIEYSNESGYNNVISVYDKKGNSKYDTYLSQENIISLQMLENAKKIIFAEAVSESSNIGIKLRMIDITKNQDEQIKDIISLDNSFLYKFIVEGQNIYALLDDSIVSIDINSSNVNTLKEFDNTQLLFVDINNNYYTYLEREINEDRYIIENVNYDGQVISSTYVDSVPKYMISSDYVNYYIYQDYVHILNKWGVDLGNRQTNFTPKESIVFNNDKSLALIYTNKIYIINL